jgi:SAM-dependent methyltransferase
MRVSIEIPLSPTDVFASLTDELLYGLDRLGLVFKPGPHGLVLEGTGAVGSVETWEPDRVIALEWHPARWQAELVTHIILRLEPIDGGTRVIFEYSDWERLFGDANESLGWFAGEVIAQLLRVSAPAALGSWITDRWARRPSGARSRATYRAPLYHYPSFKVTLEELALTADDYLLDVGCGGGAFHKEALESGCRAAGLDHSPAMLQVAAEVNQEAVAEGRLILVKADANRLPFEPGTFTSAAMHGVLGFLSDPVAVLRDIRRVLRPGGRLVLLGTETELKGTPACPEPLASHLRFYDDEGLRRLGIDAGFANVAVVRRNLEALAREAGIPEPHLPMFAAHDARFLTAVKL